MSENVMQLICGLACDNPTEEFSFVRIRHAFRDAVRFLDEVAGNGLQECHNCPVVVIVAVFQGMEAVPRAKPVYGA